MMINKGLAKRIAVISGIGWVMVASCFIGLGIGYYLDKFLKTSPLFTIIFLLLGIIAGFYEGIRMIIKSLKNP
ncbi:MAG: AtpZ/AtpI family protein [bacterium]